MTVTGHGTRASYVFGKCRCQPCRQANADYARERYRALHRPDGEGRRLVDADETRRHLARLRRHGVGLRQVSRLSGVARSTLKDIANGQPQVWTATAGAILDVEVGDQAAGRWLR